MALLADVISWAFILAGGALALVGGLGLLRLPDVFARMHGASIIESDSDYERVLPHLYPATPVSEERWRVRAEEQARGDVVLWFSVDGFFFDVAILFS